MNFWEQFLPLQNENYRLHGLGGLHPNYTACSIFDLLSTFNGYADYEDLKLEVPKHMPVEQMASNPITMAFLQFLIVSRGVKRVLELGSYVGASAIKMVQVLPADGFLTTVEKGEEFAHYTRYNTARYPRIRVVEDDALDLVVGFAADKFPYFSDMIYLDCDKQRYDEYLEPLSKLLKPGGLLVVDDVLFHGDVLNGTPNTDKGRGCLRLLEKAKTYNWPKVLLPITNGLLLMERPR